MGPVSSTEDSERTGGSPTAEELAKVAQSLVSFSAMWNLGKGLNMEDDVITETLPTIAIQDVEKAAQEIMNKLSEYKPDDMREYLVTSLMKEYGIQSRERGMGYCYHGVIIMIVS